MEWQVFEYKKQHAKINLIESCDTAVQHSPSWSQALLQMVRLEAAAVWWTCVIGSAGEIVSDNVIVNARFVHFSVRFRRVEVKHGTCAFEPIMKPFLNGQPIKEVNITMGNAKRSLVKERIRHCGKGTILGHALFTGL